MQFISVRGAWIRNTGVDSGVVQVDFWKKHNLSCPEGGKEHGLQMADETHVSYFLLPESLLHHSKNSVCLLFGAPPAHKSTRTKKQERKQYQQHFESWNSEGYGITD